MCHPTFNNSHKLCAKSGPRCAHDVCLCGLEAMCTEVKAEKPQRTTQKFRAKEASAFSPRFSTSHCIRAEAFGCNSQFFPQSRSSTNQPDFADLRSVSMPVSSVPRSCQHAITKHVRLPNSHCVSWVRERELRSEQARMLSLVHYCLLLSSNEHATSRHTTLNH